MVYLVRFREYTFGGLRQRTIAVAGTALRGTATEQRAGGWGWFLRYPDGELAGEGRAGTWAGALAEIGEALAEIGEALAMEARHGQLSYPARDATP